MLLFYEFNSIKNGTILKKNVGENYSILRKFLSQLSHYLGNNSCEFGANMHLVKMTTACFSHCFLKKILIFSIKKKTKSENKRKEL